MADGAGLDWGIGNYEWTAAQLEPAAHVLVEAAELRPGERVLDLGCGTGNASLIAARTGAVVTAIDPAPRLVEVARARAEAEGLAITFDAGHGSSIPAPDGSFDAIISSFAVIFAPDPDAVAEEIARVLTAAGRLVLSAWRMDGPIIQSNVAATVAMLEAVGAPAPPPPAMRWDDPESLDDVFGRYGFLATVTEHQHVFTAASVEEYVDHERANHPMAVSGAAMLQQTAKADEAMAKSRARMIEVLTAANEDPAAMRVTNRYVVATLRRR